MSVAKTSINGNDYIGAFAVATDKFAILSKGVPLHKVQLIEEALGVKCVHASISGSGLVGLYIAANSNGVLLPGIMYEHEVEEVRKALPGYKVQVLNTNMTALRNNILVNDKVAIVDPDFSSAEIQIIKDTLGVEVRTGTIGGFRTVGANNILTNKGIVLNNRCSDYEKEEMERIVGYKGEQSTANRGSVHIGLCTIANSNGIVLGEDTTGIEESRIANSLELL